MNTNTLPKYLKQAFKESSKVGWTWDHGKHVTVRDASGEFVVCISTTAYDGSLTKKTISKLRRAGCPGI